MAADAVVGLAEDVEAVAGVFQMGAEGGGVERRPPGLFQAWTRWTYWPLQ